MKSSAADSPYEFFHWKSSCGRLAVRTTWVRGIRHIVLSDDDDDDYDVFGRAVPGTVNNKERRQRPRDGRTAGNGREPTNADRSVRPTTTSAGVDGDYVERVLRWLHRPSGVVFASDFSYQIPMSAPDHHRALRRPALVKTCSIPGCKSGDRQATDVGTEIGGERSTKFTRRSHRKKNADKTELHVHMPSMCDDDSDKGVLDECRL